MKAAHRIVGLVGVATFLATGAYMRRYYPGMDGLDGGTRMLFRSRHIYLLLASLLNLGLGTYYRPFAGMWRRLSQVAGSCLILAAPPLLAAAFFREAPRSDLDRPFTNPAIFGLFVGTLGHALGGAGRSD
jgi:hypothetical protein